MKKIYKYGLAIVAGLAMVATTIIGAMATDVCTDCGNKGAYIEADIAASAQALVSNPYSPVVMVGGILVLVWVGYELYKRYKK